MRHPITFLRADLADDEFFALIHGMEVISGQTRAERLGNLDFLNPTVPINTAQKVMAKMRRGFVTATMINWWNTRLKVIAGTQGMFRTIRYLEDVFEHGRKMTGRERDFLRTNGINDEMATRIWGQLKRWRRSESIDGSGGKVFWWANTRQWQDKEAARALKEMVTQIADSAVVTPGVIDLPDAFDTRLGSFFFQFKTFGVSATNRTLLAGVTRNDANFYMGMVMLLGLGHMVDVAKALISGREIDWDNTGELAVNAIDRSGLLGIFTEANAILERATLGKAGLSPLFGSAGVRRYSDRDLVDALLGPSVGTLERGRRIIGMPFQERITQGDVTALRRILPWNQIFYVQTLLDRVAGPSIYGSQADRRFERNLFNLPETR
jgi:hypothetical protein